MNIVALVTIDGQPLANGEIAVFAGEECRSATLTDDEGMAYITVPGEDATELTFRTYCQGVLISSKQQCTYANNGVLGSHRLPLAVAFFEEDATAVNATTDRAEDTIYDLAGRKLENSHTAKRSLQQGIYIVNGKKMAVKR